MYEPIVAPTSRPPVADKLLTVITYNKVGNNAISTTRNEPINFPMVKADMFKGFVRKISKVPVRNSSEKLLIVIAGIRNNKIHGANSKNCSSVA